MIVAEPDRGDDVDVAVRADVEIGDRPETRPEANRVALSGVVGDQIAADR